MASRIETPILLIVMGIAVVALGTVAYMASQAYNTLDDIEDKSPNVKSAWKYSGLSVWFAWIFTVILLISYVWYVISTIKS